MLCFAAKPTASYAAQHFATQLDYARHCEEAAEAGTTPTAPEDFRLELPETLKRARAYDDADGGVFLSERLCASPGVVVAANVHVVEHTCSTLPKMSGAPCK